MFRQHKLTVKCCGWCWRSQASVSRKELSSQDSCLPLNPPAPDMCNYCFITWFTVQFMSWVDSKRHYSSVSLASWAASVKYDINDVFLGSERCCLWVECTVTCVNEPIRNTTDSACCVSFFLPLKLMIKTSGVTNHILTCKKCVCCWALNPACVFFRALKLRWFLQLIQTDKHLPIKCCVLHSPKDVTHRPLALNMALNGMWECGRSIPDHRRRMLAFAGVW